MKITEIKLNNFKNHTESTFSFVQGINAISGPNGSGKSSILEAISWALFDYIPYKNTDNLIFNGTSNGSGQAKSASVRITFLSNLDNKKYTVFRNTKRQYYLADTETEERIAETKREILPFLKKHYNLSESTNLEELFTNTIGVPQGTLTSAFLQTATNRKKIFDKVLNLEDYRNAFDKLIDFKNFIKKKKTEIEIELAKLSTNIDQIPEIEKNIKESKLESQRITSKIEKTNKTLPALEKDLADFENISTSIKDKQKNIEQLENHEKLIDQNLKEVTTNYNEAKSASQKTKELESSYLKYKETKEDLKLFETKRDIINKLEKSINDKEKELQNVDNKINNLEEKLKDITTKKEKIKELEPQVKKQIQLEKEKSELESLVTQIKMTEESLYNLKTEYEELKEKLKTLKQQLKELEVLKETAQSFEALNKEFSTLQLSLKEIESVLKENKKLANQVKGGMCPFLKEECQNMKEGQDLESYFEEKIQEITSKENDLNKNIKLVQESLEHSKLASEKYKKNEVLVNEQKNLESKLQKLLSDIKNNEKFIEDNSITTEKLITLNNNLEEIGSPKEHINIFKQDINNEDSINKSLSTAKNHKSKLNKEIKSIKQEIIDIDYNENSHNEAKKEIISLEKDYNEYIKQETIAKKLNYYKEKLNEFENKNKEISNQIESGKKELDSLESSYDKAKHTETKDKTEKIKVELAVDKNKLKNIQDKIIESETLLEKNKKYETDIKEKQKNIDELQVIEDFVDTSRDIFKNCGSLVGKFFIENISIEANQLYQDITGKTEHNLSWDTDYEISIEEKGYSRTFANLSGGEQMAAALSVRLALLRELSDVNIAFFDEPTTNMDETRRTNLAAQIKNLTHFDQLFIISHDDTFEQDIDNVIRLN